MRSTILCTLLICLAPLVSAGLGSSGVSSSGRRLLDAPSSGKPKITAPQGADLSNIQLPPTPIFEATVGAAFGTQGSIAQTGPTGECVAQSFSAGTGQTVSIGGGQSQVGGSLSGESGCGENAKPLSSGASFSTGFVVTGAIRTGTVGGPTNCISNTNGFGRSNTFTRGDIKTSAGSAFEGASACDDSKTG